MEKSLIYLLLNLKSSKETSKEKWMFIVFWGGYFYTVAPTFYAINVLRL